MAFTALDVKKLREQTGCGMMDCKKALTESDGDFDKAVEYLTDSLSVMRARTRGVTVETDGSFSEEMTEVQRQCYDGHWLLQYDLMFGKPYLEDYTPQE